MSAQPLRIVVGGSSAAGPKDAAKARRLDEYADITVIQRARELSMASCGFSYYVGGTFDDRNPLICTRAGVVRDSALLRQGQGHRCADRDQGAEHRPSRRPSASSTCRTARIEPSLMIGWSLQPARHPYARARPALSSTVCRRCIRWATPTRCARCATPSR